MAAETLMNIFRVAMLVLITATIVSGSKIVTLVSISIFLAFGFFALTVNYLHDLREAKKNGDIK